MKLLDICEAIVDCPHSTAKDEGKGYPLIRTPNIGKGRLKFDGVHRVSEQVYNQRNERAVPQAGDLILAREAPVGNVAIIRQGQQVCLGQRTVLIKPNKKYVDPDFLVYYLLSPELQHKLLSSSNGATVSHLNMSSIRSLEVQVPGIDVQKRIGAILARIDDKIELNAAINENLELQAQAIFKSWFVDFEPFGGVMPVDWNVGAFSDVADVLSGKRPPMKQNDKTEDASIPLIGAAAIMGYTNKFNHDDKILVIGRVGTHGIVQRFDYPCWTSDNTLVIKSNYYEYTYQILKLIDYKAMNRGSTQPLITQGDLKKTEIIIPSKECLQKYENIVGSLMYQYSQNRTENEKLALLRDTLLPKLMNGEIDVSKVRI